MTILLFRSICFIALVGYRKRLVAKIIHLSSAPNIVEIVKSVVSLAKQLIFSLAKAQSMQ